MLTKIVSMFCSSLAAFILGLLLSPSLMVTTGDKHRADAAFSDGVFLATLDFQRGRRPHLASGRWSTDQDRASFIAGYEQTYRELADSRSAKPAAPTANELASYGDGKLDGTRDRNAAQPFQMNKTENYRTADQYYRAAYSNGYQEGYYARTESADLRMINGKSGLF